MNVLFTNRRIFSLLCIPAAIEPSSLWNKAINITFSIAILTIQLSIFTASALFFIKFIESDFENSLYALFQVAAAISGIYTIFAAFLLRNKILWILNKYQSVYERNKKTFLFIYIAQANRRSERIAKYYIKYLICGYFISVAVLAIGNIIYCWAKDGFGDIDEELLFVPFKFV